jgi:deoxyguanosine kinase
VKRIEICGNIASGKTSLAQTFMVVPKCKVIFEDFKKNPFWIKFYEDPGKYAFETEISFLIQHYHEIKQCMEDNDSLFITDFSYILDFAYARVGLTSHQIQIFTNLTAQIHSEIGPPDLVVNLTCDTAVCYERILSRGRQEETSIEMTFLLALQDQLDRLVRSSKGNIVVIDSSKVDFRGDSITAESIASRLE